MAELKSRIFFIITKIIWKFSQIDYEFKNCLEKIESMPYLSAKERILDILLEKDYLFYYS